VAALLLSFQADYQVYANFILIDVPVAVAFLVFALALPRQFTPRSCLWLGSVAALALLFKWSAVMLVPVFVALRLIEKPGSWREFWLSLGLFALVPGVMFLLVIIFFGMPFLGGVLSGGYFREGPWFYLQGLRHYFSHYPVLAGAFFLGIVAVIKERSLTRSAMGLFVLVPIVCLSFAAEKIPRYFIPVWPFVFLLTALGVEYSFSMFIKRGAALARGLCLVLLSFIMLAGFQDNYRWLAGSGLSHTGFREAGQVLRDMDTKEAVIWAGSVRQVAYFSGMGWSDLGGRVVYDKMTSAEFDRRVKAEKNRIILVLDRWEFTQPPSLYPFSADKHRYLESLGFKAVRQISSGGMPVIWIYQRSAITGAG
jgi:hypothetical protein